MATNEEKKEALDLFNSFDGGLFKELVLEAGNDKNSEKGAGMVILCIQCCGAVTTHFLAVAAFFWLEPEPPLWRWLRRAPDPAPSSSSNLFILPDEF